MKTIPQRIAEELSVQIHQVQAAVQLIDNGATIPFIARYRKEATGGLTDTQLRLLEERLIYLRELEERRQVILNSIREQDKLTLELETALQAADTKTRLEDLYLPYKPKRRTKAQLAREAGLEPLALGLLQEPQSVPTEAAEAYIDTEKGIQDSQQALEGARQILMEKFAEEAELLGQLREYIWEQAILTAKVVEGEEEKGKKFADYFDYQEPLKQIPSHRALALFRGRNEGILQLRLTTVAEIDENTTTQPHYCEQAIARHFNIQDQNRPADAWLLETVRWAWRFKIRLHLDTELFMRLREMAEAEAIQVFASNLQDLLLAAPAGHRVTLGLDPGLRTGVKVAVVDNTGKLLETTTIYPHPPKNEWQQSIAVLVNLIQRHHVELISIGNGTASRETDKLVAELIKQHAGLRLHKLVVSEAGASVYSASALAAQELATLDVAMRGAVSIARRLQDPLAELVKIDPKAIGVGQYQHDVNQVRLARGLNAVVEDCVNAVGVDVNTASVPLLSRVSGLSEGLARNIVAFRDEHGTFVNRDMLKKVSRFGEKTFEQAAGFLRIINGDNPLDASAVHPEAYPVIEHILAKTQEPIRVVMGNTALLQTLKPKDYVDDKFGMPTVTDILKELEKPGRDPRPEFKTAAFKEGIEEIKDLRIGMVLEGVVTNVTNFGAFVDIGVHQDGLVHISALSQEFVKDPRTVVKAGDVVKVKVLEVDVQRRRISLTMCLKEPVASPPQQKEKPAKVARKSTATPEQKEKPAKVARKSTATPVRSKKKPEKSQKQPELTGIMAQAFAEARKR